MGKKVNALVPNTGVYELDKGKTYLMVMKRGSATAKMREDFQDGLTLAGVNTVTLVTDDDPADAVAIFEASL